MNDPHRTLGVSHDAEPEVVDAAYRALMKKYHPDRWRGDEAEGRERAQLINGAYAAIRSGGWRASGGEKPDANRPADQSPEPASDQAIVIPPYSPVRGLLWTMAATVAIIGGIALLGRL